MGAAQTVSRIASFRSRVGRVIRRGPRAIHLLKRLIRRSLLKYELDVLSITQGSLENRLNELKRRGLDIKYPRFLKMIY